MEMDVASLLKAALLGIVEGATEFIPVSSTGHLILVQDWLNFHGEKENAFLVFIQLGAILAVLWLYREKFLYIARSWRDDPHARRLVVNLIIGTLPAVVIGLPTEDWIEERLFYPLPVAIALAAGGVAMLLIERKPRKPHIETVDEIPYSLALGVGMVQVLAILFPGLSRSGATIMGGLLLGLSRRATAEFSFFLAIPAMCGASAIKLFKVRDLITVNDLPTFAVGFFVSFVAALIAIRALLAFVSHNSFVPFAWYRIALGAVVIAWYWR
jgi:undecaprenyl-diphosphatase